MSEKIRWWTKLWNVFLRLLPIAKKESPEKYQHRIKISSKVAKEIKKGMEDK